MNMKRIKLTTSTLALLVAGPVVAQENVQVLTDWSYDSLYADGWSVENMFDTTEIIGTNGEDIGDVENVIFSNDGEVLGIIAQVGGFWDIGDTHVHVPWDEVNIGETIQQAQIPVTEENVDNYDVFGDYWGSERLNTEADAGTTDLDVFLLSDVADDDLVAGPGIFKATDLIGSFAYLSDGVRYGYVADIIVENGVISAIVADTAAYGRRGYYAHPFSYRGTTPMANNSRYDVPYDGTEIDTIENFDYEQLQSRGTE
jgi:sporulation protein YlmC with PRC-barrel domain